jgi:hypothetical protein
VVEHGAELYALLERIAYLERSAVKQQRVLRWLYRLPLEQYAYHDSEVLGGLLLLRELLPRRLQRTLETLRRLERQGRGEESAEPSLLVSMARLREPAIRHAALWLLHERQEAPDELSTTRCSGDRVAEALSLASMAWRQPEGGWSALLYYLQDAASEPLLALVALRAAVHWDRDAARLAVAAVHAPSDDPARARPLWEIYLRHLYLDLGELTFPQARLQVIQGRWV